MEEQDRTVNTWRKSAYSGCNGSNCVEVAAAPGSVLVRDTKHRAGTTLTFTPTVWQQFSTALKR